MRCSAQLRGCPRQGRGPCRSSSPGWTSRVSGRIARTWSSTRGSSGGVHDGNNLDQLDFDNEIDCSVLGDAAYKVTWDPQEERVRVSAPDVQGLYAWWPGDDPGRGWRGGGGGRAPP